RQQCGGVCAYCYETVGAEMKKTANTVYKVVADRKSDEDADIVENSYLITGAVTAEKENNFEQKKKRGDIEPEFEFVIHYPNPELLNYRLAHNPGRSEKQDDDKK